DHYAIIPTGQVGAAGRLSDLSRRVYEQICRRFLAIFFPPAVYSKTAAEFETGGEHFFANAKVLKEEGYLRVLGIPKGRGAVRTDESLAAAPDGESEEALERLSKLRKGTKTGIRGMYIREGETKPPSRYNSGSLILAMENAGQLIEEDELREQIRGSGIGTSATRAEILAKLVRIGYLHLNKKTQIITPELLGEMVYDVVDNSIRPLLSAELTASWEKGLAGVAGGSITTEEYMGKMEGFVARRTNAVKSLNNQSDLKPLYDRAAAYYSGGGRIGRSGAGGEKRKSKVKP
ncbi:MAG: DNA topoisomerase, partial [Lachnospiraceae bacterium]|nr:DNA topoisomerase [Lachnospiraceae bacterium]